VGEFTRLMARDGHQFDAWLAAPPGMARGAVLVLQEIFGVNAHVQAVADGFAAAGYVSIAPCLFDRARRGVEMGYGPEELQLGRGYVLQLKEEGLLRDMQACINVVKHAGGVAAVGYCWGGSLAYLAACELPVACAVSYYGTRTVQLLDRRPRVPVQYHFGAQDKTIPPENIAKIRAADPGGEFHVYDADHGFNCDHRAAWNPEAAQLARERTLAFIERHLTGTDNGPGDDMQQPDKWADA
jgi:carboxymethylenebutenolidase